MKQTEIKQRQVDKETKNIGLTIPGNWPFEIRRISCVKSGRFHEICEIQQISGEIHMKSGGFHEIHMKSVDFT